MSSYKGRALMQIVSANDRQKSSWIFGNWIILKWRQKRWHLYKRVRQEDIAMQATIEKRSMFSLSI